VQEGEHEGVAEAEEADGDADGVYNKGEKGEDE